MEQLSRNLVAEQLTSRPVPALSARQLEKFSDFESIHAQSAGHFDAVNTAQQLQAKVGQRMVAFECGGGSVRGGSFVVDASGSIVADSVLNEKTESDDGAGFLTQMEAF